MLKAKQMGGGKAWLVLRPRPRLPLRVIANHAGPRSFMGRFGGGWQWKVGVQAAGREAIVSLLVFDVQLRWRPTTPSWIERRQRQGVV